MLTSLLLRAPVVFLCLGSVLAAAAQAPSGYVGNEACGACHSEIVKTYSMTPMAHASGFAKDAPATADLMHAASGVHYRIFSEEGKLWLSYSREHGAPLQGKKELLYYIGSGKRGPITEKLQSMFFDLVNGRSKKYQQWLTHV